jgi:hypothetical protein
MTNVVIIESGKKMAASVVALVKQPIVPVGAPIPDVGLVEITAFNPTELIPGPRGSLWYTGTGAPVSFPGQADGDMYLDNANDHIWRLEGGVWVDTGTDIAGSPDTGAQILAKLLPVDGAGSALDADYLDGQDSTYFATAAALATEASTRASADAGLQSQITNNLATQDTRDDNQDTLIAANNTALADKVAKAGDTMTGKLNTAASAGGAAGFNIPHGAAPASPVNGDIWTTTTNLSWRQNGATYNAANLNGSQQFTGAKTFTVPPVMATPAAGQASIRLPAGVAPTTPTDGDMWGTSTGLFARVNGVTYNLTNTFPEAPVDGQQYVRQNAAWAPVDVPPGTIMSDTPPVGPDPGQMWWESDSGNLFIWYADGTSSQWVQINGGSGQKALISDTPPSNPVHGDIWYESDTGNFYVYVDDGTSQQWIAPNVTLTGDYVPISGGTMTGALGVNAGLVFPATQVPSSDVNTLDDYEEGTWTPVIFFGGNNVGLTYGTRFGQYVKIGRLVILQFDIPLTAKGTSTGAATIANMPFNNAYQYAGCSLPYWSGMANCGGSIGLYSGINSSTISLVTQNSAASISTMNDTHFTNTSRLIGSFIYIASN